MKATAIEIWPTSAENHLPVGSSSPNSNKHERRYTANIYNSGRWCFSICIYVILYEYIYIYTHIYTYIYIYPHLCSHEMFGTSHSPNFPSPHDSAHLQLLHLRLGQIREGQRLSLQLTGKEVRWIQHSAWTNGKISCSRGKKMGKSMTFLMFNGNVWEIRTFLESSKFSQHKSSP